MISNEMPIFRISNEAPKVVILASVFWCFCQLSCSLPAFLLPDQPSRFRQTYVVLNFIADLCDLAWNCAIGALCLSAALGPGLLPLRPRLLLQQQRYHQPSSSLPTQLANPSADSLASALTAALEILVGSPSAGAKHIRRA